MRRFNSCHVESFTDWTFSRTNTLHLQALILTASAVPNYVLCNLSGTHDPSFRHGEWRCLSTIVPCWGKGRPFNLPCLRCQDSYTVLCWNGTQETREPQTHIYSPQDSWLLKWIPSTQCWQAMVASTFVLSTYIEMFPPPPPLCWYTAVDNLSLRFVSLCNPR